MLKYLDENGRNAELTIDAEKPNLLHVNAFLFEGMVIQPKDFDMQEHAGKMVRVYLDADGSYSMEHGTHEWLLFMLKVPQAEYENTYDDDGTHSEQKELPVNLNDTDITIFPLPDEEAEA